VLPLDRTQIPRPSGEGKARAPRHVDPRAVAQSHARQGGERNEQRPANGQARGHGHAHGPGHGAPRSAGGRSGDARARIASPRDLALLPLHVSGRGLG